MCLMPTGIVGRAMAYAEFPRPHRAVSAGLLAAAALASYLPAHRSAPVNPVEALRTE